MRISTILLACLCLAGGANAQSYFVLSVKGDVSADGRALQKKDKLDETVQLRFGSAEALVYVLAPGKGYYILSGRKAAPERSSEILLSLREALFPPNEFHSTSTRGAELADAFVFPDQHAMRQFFRDDLFLIGLSAFTPDAKTFPLDDQHYFELVHVLPDAAVTKRLPSREGRFFIDESVFMAGGGEIDSGKIKYSSLAFVNEPEKERTHLGDFHLSLLGEEEVLGELRALHQAVSPVASNVFYTEHAKPYLSSCYGHTDWAALRRLIDEEFGS